MEEGDASAPLPALDGPRSASPTSGHNSSRITAERADTLVFLMDAKFPGHQESLALREYLGVSIIISVLSSQY